MHQEFLNVVHVTTKIAMHNDRSHAVTLTGEAVECLVF